MSYFLCGNTGRINRGCEAIIRSTIKLLNQRNGDIYLATFAPEQDRSLAADLGINMIAYEGYPSDLVRYVCGGIHKINHKSLLQQKFIQRDLWGRISDGDTCLNIGGDTYCYKRPEASIALNKHIYRHGNRCILWCCSIEKNKITGEILRDLKRYTYIFAREQITYQNLIESGIPKEKIIRCCDPAFFLDKQEVELPSNFQKGNTIGINISEMIVKEDDVNVYPAVLGMLKYVLNKTDMSICLIPHVYSIEENKCDYPILKRLFEDLQSKRVSLISNELNCEELKYIISHCRFVIAARTHASIAAYSSYVPTLVLGYSVKSLGIAMDLFGQADRYVIPYTEIRNKEQLIEAFEYLHTNEDIIKKRLIKSIPEYKNTLTSAIEQYITEPRLNKLCDNRLCTGCGACAACCPMNCITMEPDEKGFAHPFIDTEKCVNCGKCTKVCPVSNRIIDRGIMPIAYAAQNRDENIRRESSSGGVFFELAKEMIKQNGVVIGATIDADNEVKHICCTTMEMIPLLQGSKYVQSDLGNIFEIAKENIRNNIPVLFSGTPCQIAGLKAYLNENPENLITVDMICHGVPTPALWEKYKEFREKQASSEIRSVSFRNKTEGWKNFSLRLNFQNGSEYRKTVGEDSYLQFFVNDFSIRDSCNLCPFRTMNRQADITLADFWNVSKMVRQITDDLGTSLVLIHTAKGKALMNCIEPQLRLVQVDAKKITNDNTSYLKNKPSNILHQEFLEEMQIKQYKELEAEYSSKNWSLRKKIYKAYFRQLFT